MTLLTKLNQLPPFLCRVMARKKKGWAPMSISDLSVVSGLTRSKVAKISVMRSWNDVTLSDADKFSRACGVDLLDLAPAKKWLRQSPLIHIQRARIDQRRMFTKLLKAA